MKGFRKSTAKVRGRTSRPLGYRLEFSMVCLPVRCESPYLTAEWLRTWSALTTLFKLIPMAEQPL